MYFNLFYFVLAFWVVIIPVRLSGQEEDAFFIRKIYDHALTESQCFQWLEVLSEDIQARPSGSEAYDRAVEYCSQELKNLSVDTVYHQSCKVEFWERGDKDQVMVHKQNGETWNLQALSLGRSEGNGGYPISGEIVEVRSLDEVEMLGRDQIQGKIVFYNRPLDPTKIRTFNAYGGAVDQRVFGASKASEYGGIGALVRSMTLRIDDVPHTGTMQYAPGVDPVPGMAISTQDADHLSLLLDQETVQATIISNSRMVGDRLADNVIAEIKGSEYPEEIILVGGHLDSWDVGGGAHDDGAGCVHAMQVFHTLKALDYRPKRTLRCVLFANEESGLAGARKYAEVSNAKGEFHLAAIESDAGGFSPRGFSIDGEASALLSYGPQLADRVETFLAPYGIMLSTGGSGADISPLKNQKGILIGLRPDSQRYFDFHHTENDRITAVNPRELQLGAAAMTALVYLIDRHGLSSDEE